MNRISWCISLKRYVATFCLALSFCVFQPGQVFARNTLPDDQIRQRIITDSVATYHSTGHPCACPYDTTRNGSSCGRRSAYIRPGGAAPLCYPADVTDGMVNDWRNRH